MPSVIQSFYPIGATPPAPGYTFYRLNITANNGRTPMELQDIGLREVIGGPSITPAFLSAARDSEGGTDAGNAFDNNTGTIWNLGSAVGWIRAQLTQRKEVVEYTVVGTGSQGGQRNPRDWTFEGSHDAISWDILHTAVGQIGWSGGQVRVFTL